MGADAYREGIFQAWQGELWGKAFFDRLAAATDDADRRAKWQVLAELEDATGNKLAPLVAGASDPHLTDTYRSLDSAVELYESLPWHVAMEQMMSILDPAIERFRELLTQAPVEERAAVQILVDHEIALKQFAERELAGDGATSLDPVRVMIKRASNESP